MKVSSILTLAALLVVAGAHFAQAEGFGYDADTRIEAPADTTGTTSGEAEGEGAGE